MRRPDPIRRDSLFARLWQSSVVRYLAVGGFAFAFDAGVLWLLHEMIGIPLTISTPIAFLLSFVVTYTLQRTVAFRASDTIAPSTIRYAILVVWNTIATTLIVWLAVELGLAWIVGKVLAVVTTTIWNYFLYRTWVFRRRASVAESPSRLGSVGVQGRVPPTAP